MKEQKNDQPPKYSFGKDITENNEKGEHGHGRLQDPSQNHAQGNIKVALFLNITFTLIEIAGGFLTNSMAILSDALHDLGDSLSLGIAWFLEKFAQKKPDSKFTYGYSRFSLLGALINSFVLFGGSILILSRAIPRIFQPESVNPQGMLAIAVLGIIVNGIAALRMKRGASLNEKVVSWHLLEDVFGWIVILITSIVLLFIDIPVIDPILSIALAIYVLFNVAKNVKSILIIFLEGVPGNIKISEIEERLSTISRVMSIHHTHIWSLEGNKVFLSTHIVTREKMAANEHILLKQEVKELLSKNGIDHATIEIDYENENCQSTMCH